MNNIDKIINKNINNFLIKEIYNQLTIPFDNEYHDVNGISLPTKKKYEYFIDWLEENGSFGKLESKNKNLDKNKLMELINNTNFNREFIFKLLYHYGLESDSIFLTCIKELFPNLKSKDISNASKKIDKYGFEEALNYLNLNKSQEKLLLNKIYSCFLKNVNLDDFIIKDGLIYVERCITISDLFDYESNKCEFDDISKKYVHYIDFFDKLNKKYGKHVGTCWSFKKGAAYPYNCAYGYYIYLYGWVRSEDIDLNNIVFFANWFAKSEKELRLKEGTLVQIDSIEFKETVYKNGATTTTKKLPLYQSIILEA